MSVAVRTARPSDLAVALPLWQALHAEHERLDPRYRMAPDAADRWAADFRVWTRSRTSRIWLALRGGGAVGLLTAHLYEPAPTYRPQRLVHVDDLFVASPERGGGLGDRLLAEARTWGVAEGATQLRAGVLAANAAGRGFWQRQGAEDYSVTVAVSLG